MCLCFSQLSFISEIIMASRFHLRLVKGFHIDFVTLPNQRRWRCTSYVALDFNVIAYPRGDVIHFEGLVERYYRYTCK